MVVLLEDKTHGIAGGNHIKRQKYVRQGTKHPFPVVASTFLPYWQQAQKVVRQQLLQSSKQPQRVACHKSIWLLLPPTVVTVVMVSGRSKCRSSQASQDDEDNEDDEDDVIVVVKSHRRREESSSS